VKILHEELKLASKPKKYNTEAVSIISLPDFYTTLTQFTALTRFNLT